MKNRLLWIAVSGFMLAAFLFPAVPARAQSVDDKIKVLEQELSQLKEQQISLKKDAVAAEAALPEFSYRPGGGLNIAAADKAWSINFGFEGHYRMLFEAGKDQAGRTNGEIMGRRARPQFVYCINNCFYEIQHRLDMDGFGTRSDLQRSMVSVHFEQMNPWLPRLSFGMDSEMPVSLYRQGSGNFGAQAEYDLLSRNNALNTGRYGNGFMMAWDDLDLGTGRGQLNIGVATFGEGDDGNSSNSDRKDFALYLRVEPFTKMKNKWLEGFGIETMHWFCNADPRQTGTISAATASAPPTLTPVNGATTVANLSACQRLRIQDHGDGGRQTLFQFTPSGTTGRGLQDYHLVGLGWRVGPYWLRMIRGWANFNFAKNRGSIDLANLEQNGTLVRTGGPQGTDAKGRNWMISHDLFLWSPKGFLTGDTTVPGSILIGTHFERTDVSCGFPNCATGGQFARNRILLREWDIWYFLANRISIGASFLWYDASNLRSGRGQTGENLGVFRTGGACDAAGGTAACRGKGGDWTDMHLNFRMYF